jgi:hypothetical protein
VKRQRGRFLKEADFLCNDHQIYISPSTFEYRQEKDNLLWQRQEDMEYLKTINGFKRESRMARERSEDALTWNVFRYLQNHRLVWQTFERFTGDRLEDPEVIFWSYSDCEKGEFPLLNEARNRFGESKRAGTEPDLIICSKNHLIFVEAKFTSGNDTAPSKEDYLEKYIVANDGWYANVFKKDIKTVSMKDKKYELMRNYLLGTWLAQRYQKKFILFSLSPAKYDFGGLQDFRNSIHENDQFRFIFSFWEELRGVIQNHLPDSDDKDLVLEYLREKSAGYRDGKLVEAFL